VSDQVIATGGPTLYGRLAEWNTTTVPDGAYSLQSVASSSGDLSGTSASVTTTVDNRTGWTRPRSLGRVDSSRGLSVSAGIGIPRSRNSSMPLWRRRRVRSRFGISELQFVHSLLQRFEVFHKPFS
jgi:hypothetical protein